MPVCGLCHASTFDKQSSCNAGVSDGLPAGALQADSAQQQRQQQRGVWHARLHCRGSSHQPHAVALRFARSSAQGRPCHAATTGQTRLLSWLPHQALLVEFNGEQVNTNQPCQCRLCIQHSKIGLHCQQLCMYWHDRSISMAHAELQCI